MDRIGKPRSLSPRQNIRRADTRIMTDQSQRIPITQMIGPVKGLLRAALMVTAAALAIEVCVLAAPLFLRIVIDRVMLSHQLDLLCVVPLVFLVLALSQGILAVGRARAIFAFSERLNHGWMSNLFDRLMRLPISYFELRGAGAISAKFWSVSYMQRVLTAAFLEGVLDGLLAILGGVLLIFIAPLAAVVATTAIFIYLAFRIMLYPKQLSAEIARSALAITQQSYLWETVSGIVTVRIGRLESLRKKIWFAELDKLFRSDEKFQMSEGAIRAAYVFLLSASRISVILLTWPQLTSGSISVGLLVAIVVYADLLLNRSFVLIDKLVAFRLLDVHRDKMQELVTEETVDADSVSTRVKDRIPASMATLHLHGIALSTPTGEILISSGELFAKAGECIVIVGPSGAGKTTLLKAMLGLIDFDSGDYRLAGEDLRTIGTRRLFSSVATVLREDRLFNTSIFENIRLGADQADRNWAVSCARAVGLHEYILGLSDGYDTVIKDDGSHLSAGQRQRLLIARAICRRPSILFLDEATSHLDPKSEQDITRLIGSLDATKVLVSHRPAPLEIADRVYRLEDTTLALDRAFKNSSQEVRASRLAQDEVCRVPLNCKYSSDYRDRMAKPSLAARSEVENVNGAS